ncbi:hypothetical protein SRABI83_03787 [Arthrobacter sp. Bi83]|nr:hypothetical protein SRABI83_03787 [Arthrobacter sp. Bi83]
MSGTLTSGTLAPQPASGGAHLKLSSLNSALKKGTNP